MNNTVCTNYNYNINADVILDLISLNCNECEFDGHCDIQTAYYKAKDYAVSECQLVRSVKEATDEEIKEVINGKNN